MPCGINVRRDFRPANGIMQRAAHVCDNLVIASRTRAPTQLCFGSCKQHLNKQIVAQLLRLCVFSDRSRHVAIQMLAELEELSQHRYVSSYWRTLLYLSLGNRDEAIRRLEQAIADHESLTITLIKVDPMLDPLRGNPRFEALVQKVFAVEKVNPELVIRDEGGKPITVRYEAVNAMLLNEFLKEHKKAQAQERKVEELEVTVAKQQKQIEALTATVQRVSDRLELSKPAPQMVADNQ